MATECLFCRIANGDIPTDLVYQDDLIAAFRDINPAAPVHILIVPKRHFSDIVALVEEGDGEVLARIYATAAALARKEDIVESGFRVVVNTGSDAGQTVQHVHFHLLGGRAMGWPPG